MTTTAKPTERLTLTAAERKIIVEEYDSYPRGDARRGALLRRYGLYTSPMSKWRERLKRGDATLATVPPGPKPARSRPSATSIRPDASFALAPSSSIEGIASASPRVVTASALPRVIRIRSTATVKRRGPREGRFSREGNTRC